MENALICFEEVFAMKINSKKSELIALGLDRERIDLHTDFFGCTGGPCLLNT